MATIAAQLAPDLWQQRVAGATGIDRRADLVSKD
jgi:hypothetical protein